MNIIVWYINIHEKISNWIFQCTELQLITHSKGFYKINNMSYFLSFVALILVYVIPKTFSQGPPSAPSGPVNGTSSQNSTTSPKTGMSYTFNTFCISFKTWYTQ